MLSDKSGTGAEVKNATVPALERALNIVEYLAEAARPVTLKTLSAQLGIPMSSAFRLIKNLTNRGYVRELDGGQATYVLGDRITTLALRNERGGSLRMKALPYMNDLSARLDQTVQLAVMRNEELLYIEQVLNDSTASVSVVAPLYTPLNIHTSASGKLLFGYQTPEMQERCLAKMSFAPATGNTITDPVQFWREAQISVERGYAVDDEEYAVGIGCLAVPIFKRGACVACLGITGSIANYKISSQFDNMLRTLQSVARELTDSLYFQS